LTIIGECRERGKRKTTPDRKNRKMKCNLVQIKWVDGRSGYGTFLGIYRS